MESYIRNFNQEYKQATLVTIIGAGLSGLSLAYHLEKAGLEYLLLEASGEPGGYIKTIQAHNCVLELGPNSILCDNEILDLFKNLGLENELVPANPVSKARYIFKNGQYRQLPDNPLKMLFGNFFSASTKLKILKEPFAPVVEKEDETLEEFFIRRFGKEVADYALNPFIAGIYAGDPKDILIEETFPVLKEYERKFGSVIKGFIKNKPARKESYTFRNGMQALPLGIARNILPIQFNSKLVNVHKNGNELILTIESGGELRTLQTDAIVITTPSFAVQDSLKDLYPEFSKEIGDIYYPPICVVHSVYDKSNVQHSLNGFGGLNPKIENQFSSGSIWSSSVFSNRCPENKVLFTSFIGGSLNTEKTQLPESLIKEKVHEELAKNFNISADPEFQHYFKWNRSIPQYTNHIKKIKSRLKVIENDKIFFCTNWVDGVSLGDCLKKGRQFADKIIKLGAC